MIKILTLIAIIFLIAILLSKFLIVPIYRASRRDQEGIKKELKKVEDELKK